MITDVNWWSGGQYALAETVVAELVTDGTARLNRGRWIGPRHEHQEVAGDELDTDLRHPST